MLTNACTLFSVCFIPTNLYTALCLHAQKCMNNIRNNNKTNTSAMTPIHCAKDKRTALLQCPSD